MLKAHRSMQTFIETTTEKLKIEGIISLNLLVELQRSCRKVRESPGDINETAVQCRTTTSKTEGRGG